MQPDGLVYLKTCPHGGKRGWKLLKLHPSPDSLAEHEALEHGIQWNRGLKSAGYQIPQMNDALLLMQQQKEPKLFLTPGIQVMEKQLLNLLEPDNPCSWSKTSSGGEKHPKELQETELATQKLCSLKTQGCTLHSVPFEKACSAFSPCLHTVPAFRDFVNKLGASPAGWYT